MQGGQGQGTGASGNVIVGGSAYSTPQLDLIAQAVGIDSSSVVNINAPFVNIGDSSSMITVNGTVCVPISLLRF